MNVEDFFGKPSVRRFKVLVWKRHRVNSQAEREGTRVPNSWVVITVKPEFEGTSLLKGHVTSYKSS